MPLRFCACPGCAACPPGQRAHTFGRDTSPGRQRCAPCQAVADNERYARRGSTAERGYGSQHRQAREQALAAFEPGQPCARCGDPIQDADDADLDHTDDRRGLLGLSHASCNRATGARSRRAGRRPAADPEPEGGDDDWSIGIALSRLVTHGDGGRGRRRRGRPRI